MYNIETAHSEVDFISKKIRNLILNDVRRLFKTLFCDSYLERAEKQFSRYTFEDCFEDYDSRKPFKNLKIIDVYGYKSGATKLVLPLMRNSKYVIKIPYNYNEYEERPFYKANKKISSKSSSWNYIETERFLFNAAKCYDEELTQIFLPNFYIGSVFGIPIYLQKSIEEVLEDKRTAFSSTQDERDRAIDYTYLAYTTIKPSWCGEVIHFYDEDFLNRLINFINCYCIDDLHSGNLAFDEKGFPIILDYGGYEEENSGYEEENSSYYFE